MLKGKFGYMSPEQVRGLPLDRRSDMFAIGIVLYELLTGERLFVGESDFSTLEKVRNVEILPPSTYNPQDPARARAHRAEGAGEGSEERYQNAIELHDDLQAFLYTAGEFYSRKDLAAWMKKNFADEIEEENAKLELFRQIAAPAAPPPRSRRRPPGARSRRWVRGGRRRRARRRRARPHRRAARAQGHRARRRWTGTTRSWTPRSSTRTTASPAEPATRRTAASCSSRTTTVPSPASRRPTCCVRRPPPEHLVTPPPVLEPPRGKTPPSPAAAGHTARAARPTGPTPAGGALAKSTLVGDPDQQSADTARHRRLGAACGTGITRPSSPRLTLPPPYSSPSPSSGIGLPGGPPMMPSVSSSGDRRAARRGAAPAAPVARRPLSPLAAAAVLIIGGSGFWYWWSMNRPGSLQLTVAPADSTVSIDNVKVGDHSPITIDKPPGTYLVSVTRDGYLRNDQNVELRAGQQARSRSRSRRRPTPDSS